MAAGLLRTASDRLNCGLGATLWLPCNMGMAGMSHIKRYAYKDMCMSRFEQMLLNICLCTATNVRS